MPDRALSYINSTSSTHPIIIVGGGPVGLFLGLCLHRLNLPVIILEKRATARPGSRSLGIHPVSLERFDRLGIADPFVQEGVAIQKGQAFSNRKKIGTLSFKGLSSPYDYILALPQVRTEQLLAKQLQALDGQVLQRGAEVLDVHHQDDHITLSYRQNETIKEIKGRFLVGCDGKDSIVREKAGISFRGKAYPDTYIMGDFTDNTSFGSEAAIFLCREGLIESFPLPDRQRRWVVKTERYHAAVTPKDLARKIQRRIGHSLHGLSPSMVSSFGVQRYVAEQMAEGRLFLAGDAAHIVSPIGGQGMNLGWLDAWDLAHTLKDIFAHKQELFIAGSRYEQNRRKAVRNSIRRAEMNMRLGRRTSFPGIRHGMVSLMLNTPLSRLMARLFTMQGIERWVL